MISGVPGQAPELFSTGRSLPSLNDRSCVSRTNERLLSNYDMTWTHLRCTAVDRTVERPSTIRQGLHEQNVPRLFDVFDGHPSVRLQPWTHAQYTWAPNRRYRCAETLCQPLIPNRTFFDSSAFSSLSWRADGLGLACRGVTGVLKGSITVLVSSQSREHRSSSLDLLRNGNCRPNHRKTDPQRTQTCHF